jgi:single-stranded-DNA-specific exonuclease
VGTVEKRWVFASREPALEARLARDLRVSAVTAQLLVARGVRDLTTARDFLRPALDTLPDPMAIDSMPRACERIERALRANERIAIHGDYDVDGMTGSAILWKYFALLGRKVDVHIPHRVRDGYGLSGASVERFAAEGVKLLITVDCGTNSAVEIARAAELGMDVIVVDHHEAPGALPPAAAIINPKAPGSTYPFRGLCSAGLAFKLTWALAGRGAGVRRGDAFQQFLLDAMAYVALGTVADVSPLTGENRVFVRYGLDALRASRSPGLRALVEKARLEDRPLDAEAISFRLAPRLNALGRLGTAQDAFELLTTDDPARIAEITALLESSNRARRDIEDRIYEDACTRVNGEAVIVLSDPRWHVGVVGIVAARLVETFSRPAFVLSEEDGVARGSARSVDGFALHEAIAACREHVVTGGGHARAAGVTVRAEQVARFRDAVNTYAASRLPGEAPAPGLRVDDEVPLGAITRGTVREMGLLAPHGEGNPTPVLVASHVRPAGEPRLMGKRNTHLSFHVSQNGGAALRAVAFDGAAWLPRVRESKTVSLAFTPQINAWNGREEVELLVHDLKPV